MRWTIAHTYVGSLFGALITCCGVVLFVSIHFMKVPIEDELNRGITRMQHVISAANETTSQNFLQCADLIAENDDFNKAVAEKDTEAASRIGIVLMKKAGSDFMTITDEKGMVIARGHSKKHGDSVTNQETVAMALKGSPAVAVVAGTEVPFTIRASYPVMHEGKLVGSVSIGTSLVAPAYLDWLKSISGVNVTIFKGDTRVMTTILKDDGNRAVGTKLQAPEILAAVLQRGETVFAHNNILGVDYNSAYWPVKDANNKIVGMWFVGMPIDQLQRLEKTAISNSVWIGVGLLVFQLILSLVLGLKVSAPVRKITAYAQAIAGGDTEAQLEVHSRDDMGHLADSLRTMETNLRKLVLEASEKAEEARKMGEEAKAAMEDARAAQAMAEQAKHEGMMSAADQIENVVEQLNASINDIAEQVESTGGALDHAASRLAETATAMEEMNSTVLEVAKNAGGASDISNAAKRKAEVGSEIVSRAVTGIQEVQRQSQALKEGMTQLDDHAKAINQIMGVISDIADQTNLLALNAAIEAARAGDAGRGFAVVADEVRKLAEKTMSSTTDVGNAIAAIQQSAGQSIQQVEKSVDNVAAATDYSNKSGEALKEIVIMVEQTADEVRAIAAASEQQSATSEEINRSIADVNHIAASTAQSMQVAMQELGSLRAQAKSLIDLIEHMKKG
ncbi:HAMP domain-containing protein [Desulfovibrio desulfuricans]|uniref:HAMP domain-containing protein n=1 Tax=Desulfovibrio desulfuricans TaxID=876 RepID=A0A4P7ULS2_DESDE|nr:methyl-accepting chemotaxis protein [Desulfovibrio desulfuricans]QCC85864.1 HAMP domain-containing protein [Desulfovibrio desulfuricans]